MRWRGEGGASKCTKAAVPGPNPRPQQHVSKEVSGNAARGPKRLARPALWYYCHYPEKKRSSLEENPPFSSTEIVCLSGCPLLLLLQLAFSFLPLQVGPPHLPHPDGGGNGGGRGRGRLMISFFFTSAGNRPTDRRAGHPFLLHLVSSSSSYYYYGGAVGGTLAANETGLAGQSGNVSFPI